MTQKTEHPYAHILRAIADGETIQLQHVGVWVDWENSDVLVAISTGSYRQQGMRIKPRTFNINGHEVPEPLRVAPEVGSKYWIPSTNHMTTDAVESFPWDGDYVDKVRLCYGMVHASKEAAQMHMTALLSFTKLPE